MLESLKLIPNPMHGHDMTGECIPNGFITANQAMTLCFLQARMDILENLYNSALKLQIAMAALRWQP